MLFYQNWSVLLAKLRLYSYKSTLKKAYSRLKFHNHAKLCLFYFVKSINLHPKFEYSLIFNEYEKECFNDDTAGRSTARKQLRQQERP